MPKKQYAGNLSIRSSAAARRLRPSPNLAGPERLVGLGFRYWMLGCSNGDVACWERAWSLYVGHFGIAGARVAVEHLSHWVLTVNRAAIRPIEVSPANCNSFCRDECIAVSMIAACQQQTCPAMRACAFALAECTMLDGVLDGAQAFADTMLSLDQALSPASIVNAASVVEPQCLTIQ